MRSVGISVSLTARLFLTILLLVLLTLPSLATTSDLSNGSAFKLVSADAASGIKEYRLKSNGLSVLLAERHSSPVVTVMVVYRVGSRNEAVGYTGSTHFLEHMMFKGTDRHDPLKGTGIDDILKPIGGLNNATTFYDRTYYYEVIPTQGLRSCLELESDRMRNALLRESDRRSEMTVVRNELERDENHAASILNMNVFATAFREHPYHHPVIGWRSDVEGVPISRLRQFYKDFYYPDNATLIVIGDCKTSSTLAMIQEYFGKITKSPKPFPPVYTVEPKQEGERRFVVQRGDELPKTILAYHIDRAANKDGYALEVLSSILGDQQRQSSRLYKNLVDSGLAAQAYAGNYLLRDPGLFTIYASANEGVALSKIENRIKDELKKLAQEPVSDAELDRAKKAVWKKLKLSAADPIGMAEQLAEAIAVADWHWWLNFEQNIKAVNKKDVQNVASKYFAASNCTIGNYLPKDKEHGEQSALTTNVEPAVLPTVSSDPVAVAKEESSPIANEVVAPVLTGDARSGTKAAGGTVPGIAGNVKRRRLANGLNVLVLPIPGSGVVAVSTKVKAGQFLGGMEKPMVPELAGEMLNKGCKQISKESLADQLEMLGADIDPDVETYWTEIQSEVVNEDLERYLKLLSMVIREPSFAAGELDKVKKIKESALKDAMSETGQVAANALMRALYKPGCVFYQKTFNEQIDELKSISTDDLKEFHGKFFNPSNTCLVVVGDVSAEKAFALIEASLGSWAKGIEVPIENQACANDAITQGMRIIKPIADKSSVDIVIGKPADVSIRSKDFFAAQLANAALGHDTIASRLAEIREKHGLTYGVQSYFADNSQKNGPWLIQLSVNPENTAKALALVDKIVSSYDKNGISEAELKMEKQRLAGEYVVYRLRTPKQIADALGKYELVGVGSRFMDDYASNLQKVTKAEADNAIRKYMNIKNMVTCLAGTVPKLGDASTKQKKTSGSVH